jgi:hypothetical protein
VNSEVPEAFVLYACSVLGDTDIGFSGIKIVEYMSAYAVDFDVELPYGSYPFPKGLPNKRTALMRNIRAFEPAQQIHIINELCQAREMEGNHEAEKLRVKLINKYGHLLAESSGTSVDKELVKEVKHWLVEYPKSYDLFISASDKIESSHFKRNALDDLRLSLEKLLCELLKNRKSLENQSIPLSSALKDKGHSPELRKMLDKVILYYCHYQNNYVKHNDAVNEEELEIILEMTCSLMRFLIRALES